jgi:hypothetical protein
VSAAPRSTPTDARGDLPRRTLGISPRPNRRPAPDQRARPPSARWRHPLETASPPTNGRPGGSSRQQRRRRRNHVGAAVTTHPHDPPHQLGTTKPCGLTIREAGWLSLAEPAVRSLLGRGLLRYAVVPTRISADSVRALLPDAELRPPREAALHAVVDGRVVVPAPPTRYAPPVPITRLVAYLKADAPASADRPRSFPACLPIDHA